MGRARVGRILRAGGLLRGVTFNAGGVVVVFWAAITAAAVVAAAAAAAESRVICDGGQKCDAVP